MNLYCAARFGTRFLRGDPQDQSCDAGWTSGALPAQHNEVRLLVGVRKCLCESAPEAWTHTNAASLA